MKNKEKGITLISLIVTIIILLILAAVTINLVVGENGIFKIAQQATENYANAQDKELADMQNFNNKVSNIIGDIPSGNGASGGEATPEPPPARQAGGYDADGNLVASWETLVNDYGMDIIKDYTMNTNEVTAPKNILNKAELRSISEIIIPGNVTSIGDYAFYECDYLHSVTIEDGVTSLGEDVFAFCDELTDVTICGRLNNIGKYGFGFCSKLANVSIYGVNVIGDDAFSNCTNLTNITFKEEITSEVGACAFVACTSLTNISLPNIRTMGDSVFSGCTKLTNFTIPDNITSIPYGAFDGCTGLNSLTIPSTVTTIGVNAFRNVKHVYYDGPATSSNNWGALAFN